MSEQETAEGPQKISLGEKARQRIAALVDGNGMKGTDVRIEQIEESVYALPGILEIELKPQRATHEIPGKKPDMDCKIVGSETELETALKHAHDRILQDPEQDAILLEKIREDEGHGWGLDGVKFKIPEFDHAYGIVKQCLKCRGSGKVGCAACQGQGRVSCNKCQATGIVICKFCKKTGQIENPTTNEKQVCHHCQGRGHSICTTCQGQKSVPCGKCSGSGKENCKTCAATGSLTHITALQFEALTTFTLPEENFPPNVLAAVKAIGVREVATRKHARIKRIKPEEMKKYDEPKDGKQRLYLQAFLPYADVVFSLDTRKLPAVIVGFRATVLKAGRFMDILLKPGIEHLKHAAQGHGNAGYLIGKAGKYRALKNVLLNTSGHAEKKVTDTLLKQYPIGLSKKYARAAVHFSNQALRRVTRTARYTGLGLAITLAAGVSWAYFFTGARGQALAALPDPRLEPALDLLILAALCGAGVYLVKLMALRALKSVLPRKGKTALPDAGTSGYYALFGIPLMFLAAAFLAPDQPGWIQRLLVH